jgi:excreted virulence factor EspC (type VII ESX diderm)
MSEFYVEPAELRAYAQYMRTLAGRFDAINSFTRSEGCNTSGFTGLLAILQPVVQAVGGIYGATLDFGRDRLNGSADGLDTTAASYEATDQQQAANQDAIEMPTTPEPVGGN